MSDDLFLKIINRQIPATIVFETEDILAFKDVNPQAPVHVLIIPKTHIRTVNDIANEQAMLIGLMVQAAQQIVIQEGIADSGYRLVMNCNGDGGQTVFHLHMHLMGGRPLKWPPG